jgi:hypothetical protein
MTKIWRQGGSWYFVSVKDVSFGSSDNCALPVWLEVPSVITERPMPCGPPHMFGDFLGIG